jgi:hypothetical protein
MRFTIRQKRFFFGCTGVVALAIPFSFAACILVPQSRTVNLYRRWMASHSECALTQFLFATRESSPNANHQSQFIQEAY